MQESKKIIKTIRLFEGNNNYNNFGEEILDKVSEGVILINEDSKFEGVIYSGDNAFFIKGYLGKDVISFDMLDKSIYAFKKGEDKYSGVITTNDDIDDEELPCNVILGKLKENTRFDASELNNKIYLLKNTKILKLERKM